MNEAIETLRFQKLDERAVLPTRGSAQAAGLDVYCIDDLRIEPQSRVCASTGLAVAIPEGFYGRLAPRSGLASRHVIDVLSGVVDADYRGEIKCVLYNTGDEAVILPAASRICQLIIEAITTPTPVWVDELEDTRRGTGGFGSTGY